VTREDRTTRRGTPSLVACLPVCIGHGHVTNRSSLHFLCPSNCVDAYGWKGRKQGKHEPPRGVEDPRAPTLDLSNVKGPLKVVTLSILSHKLEVLNGQSPGPVDGLRVVPQRLGLSNRHPPVAVEIPLILSNKSGLLNWRSPRSAEDPARQ
jgi:hypothetical protein